MGVWRFASLGGRSAGQTRVVCRLTHAGEQHAAEEVVDLQEEVLKRVSCRVASKASGTLMVIADLFAADAIGICRG